VRPSQQHLSSYLPISMCAHAISL